MRLALLSRSNLKYPVRLRTAEASGRRRSHKVRIRQTTFYGMQFNDDAPCPRTLRVKHLLLGNDFQGQWAVDGPGRLLLSMSIR